MKKAYFFISIFFLLALSAASAQSISDSLRAHFKFENNTLDETSYNNDLSADSNFIAYSQFAPNDMAFEINNNHIAGQIGNFDNSSFNQTAVAMWFRADLLNNNQADQIMLQGAFAGFGLGVKNNTGSVFAFFSYHSMNAIISDSNYVDSTWHHIVAQNDGNITELYIDGVFIKSQNENYSNGSGISNVSQRKIFVGGSNLNTRHFTGAVNDVRIYKRPLTQAEIDTLSGNVTLTTNLKEKKTLSSINIYPNPTTKTINFTTDASFIGARLTVRSITGKEIYNSRINTVGLNTLSLDIRSGIYFMEVLKPTGERSVSKIIKR